MAADAITPEVSQRICAHMNDDHAEAVLMYAQVFGQATAATEAKMVAIDPLGMDMTADVDGTPTAVRIAFDHELTDSEDAHQTLIGMVRRARQPG
jgi:putative heme iron utilization protein